MGKSIYSREHDFAVKQLKKARDEAGLSQSEVAQLIGRSQSYVSKAEAGQTRLDLASLKLFANVYKKNMNFFIR